MKDGTSHRRVYVDWNATTPPHPDVLAAMARAAEVAWGNPSSVHAHGREARVPVEQAREAVAVALGGSARDVILTSGATESNNLALRSARALVTSRLEHPSVTRVAERLEAAGVPVRWLPVPSSGAVDPADLRSLIGDLPRGFTVALMAANHETGVVQPVAEVVELVHRAGGRVHVDAAQFFGKWPARVLADADSVSVAAHKIRGPKGIGALVWRSGEPPAPVLLGGSQERGVRPGTLDAVLAAGLRAAVERCMAGPERYAPLAGLRDRLEAALEGRALPNGSVPRLPHVSSLFVEGWRGDELVAALDLDGVSASSGSACSAGTPEPSAAVRAMHGEARARSTIRVSLGDTSTLEDVDRLITVLNRHLGRAEPRP